MKIQNNIFYTPKSSISVAKHSKSSCPVTFKGIPDDSFEFDKTNSSTDALYNKFSQLTNQVSANDIEKIT